MGNLQEKEHHFNCKASWLRGRKALCDLHKTDAVMKNKMMWIYWSNVSGHQPGCYKLSHKYSEWSVNPTPIGVKRQQRTNQGVCQSKRTYKSNKVYKPDSVPPVLSTGMGPNSSNLKDLEKPLTQTKHHKVKLTNINNRYMNM